MLTTQNSGEKFWEKKEELKQFDLVYSSIDSSTKEILSHDLIWNKSLEASAYDGIKTYVKKIRDFSVSLKMFQETKFLIIRFISILREVSPIMYNDLSDDIAWLQL